METRVLELRDVQGWKTAYWPMVILIRSIRDIYVTFDMQRLGKKLVIAVIETKKKISYI